MSYGYEQPAEALGLPEGCPGLAPWQVPTSADLAEEEAQDDG